MAEIESALSERLFDHRVHVNVGGQAKHPVIILWCSDCLRTIGDFDQVNDLSAIVSATDEHRREPSRREVLTTAEAAR